MGCACMLTQLCLTHCDPKDCSPPGSSVHGILQARTLEWLPFHSPVDPPDPGIEPASSALAGGFCYNWATLDCQYKCIKGPNTQTTPVSEVTGVQGGGLASGSSCSAALPSWCQVRWECGPRSGHIFELLTRSQTADFLHDISLFFQKVNKLFTFMINILCV